jgi:excisionase family DNA binding protein
MVANPKTIAAIGNTLSPSPNMEVSGLENRTKSREQNSTWHGNIDRFPRGTDRTRSGDVGTLPPWPDAGNMDVGGVAMLTVADVAEMLQCSVRSVYRLVDAGKMPPPVKLGKMIRWPCGRIRDWIDSGCPQDESIPREDSVNAYK